MAGKYRVEDLKAAAAKHGGKCLSTAYGRSDDKYQWQCARRHRWVAQFNHILHEGVWCPECAGNKPSTIKQIKKIAKDKGGRCLSKQYVNARQKLLFECAEGHKWKAGSNIIGLNHLTAACDGEIYFAKKRGKYKKTVTFVHVRPVEIDRHL